MNRITNSEQTILKTAARWLSDVLDDQAHEASNTTRMLNLYRGYHGELAAFMESVRAAWSIVVGRMPELRRPAAYFYTVLEGEIMPDVGHRAEDVKNE